MTTDLRITIIDNADDIEGWDDFLKAQPASDIIQSSLWAQLKATTGWNVLRLIIRRGDDIVGGAQILTRALPWPFGYVGYLPRGPILACQEPDVVQFTSRHLRQVAERSRIQMLIVQPPLSHELLAHELASTGFYPTTTTVAPVASLRINLSIDSDELLANMQSSTRYKVRRSQREGIKVRQGSADDLAIFSRLYAASSQRQGFSPYSEDYFKNMWRLLAPEHHVQLFISEYEGEPVSAVLLVAFGDTVWFKRFGWSGEHGGRMPNDALIWRAISWAKTTGYRYYDWEGISIRAAKALIRGDPISDSVKKSHSYFKIRFGGDAILFPEATAYIYNPAIRFAYQTVLPKVARKSTRKKLVNLLRLG